MANRDLSKFKCHFTWDFINLEKRTKLYLRDRINTIDKELPAQIGEPSEQQQWKRNFPQLYSLRGFLYVQLYQKTENGGDEFLEYAENSLTKALEECKEKNVGYKAIIYADLIHLKQMPKSVDELIKKYNALSENIENHPEVLAMKGYAASFFHSYNDAINFYEEALAHTRTPEWVFGLALAMQHRQAKKYYE